MTLLESVRNVLRAPAITAEIHLGESLAPTSNRRDLAQRSQRAIEALLWP